MNTLLFHYKKIRLRKLITRQNYNTPEFRILEILLRERPTVAVDAGACYGVYSVFMAKFCNKVFACEPIPLSCRLLNNQLIKNRVNNVEVVQVALSNTSETVKMTVPASSSSLFGDYYRAEVLGRSQSKSSTGSSIDVKSLTVDKLLEGEDDCSVIKIDVEGHEKQVLEGSVKTIAQRAPALLVEFNEPPTLKNRKTGLIRTSLEKSGYSCFYQGKKGLFYRWEGEPEPSGVNYYFLTENHLEKSVNRLNDFLRF